jgi:signal transduction histidine kinase
MPLFALLNLADHPLHSITLKAFSLLIGAIDQCVDRWYQPCLSLHEGILLASFGKSTKRCEKTSMSMVLNQKDLSIGNHHVLIVFLRHNNRNMKKDELKADGFTETSDIHLEKLDISRIALDAAELGTWIIDIETKVLLPSAHTKSLLGFSQGSLTLESLIDMVENKYKLKVQKAFQNAIKDKLSILLEFPVITSDLNQRWIRIMGGVTYAKVSKCYLSGIVMDITEQKLSDLRKEKLIVMVSHELKTPLTVLKGYVQLIHSWASQQKDAFTIGALSKVESQVKKMITMVNGFLNLSGAEAGKILINKKDFFIDDLIHEAVSEVLLLSESHKVEQQNCQHIMVSADRDKIEQVLVNLLGNAAKYSNKGTVIKISCEKSKGMVMVGIQDEGMGVSKENIEKIFDPHFRVESKETENITGFGIGLYLSSEIVKSHGGSIVVESELGKGSTFTFSIPFE